MLDDVFRDQWGRVLATLVGILGDIELAEDAAQEAFTLAAERWPRDGEPDNPTAWLIATARNRAIDRIRRDRTLARKTEQLGRELRDLPEETMDETAALPDERLELIFTCCHPALAPEAQVALTLRTLGGLSTEEVAAAFLVPFETMSKRLGRAKRKVREAGIPFAVPPAHLLPERLDAVLAVLYLVFNQGWGAGRVDLAAEAIRLGRVLAALMPDEPEALALLALMLINDSRREARHRGGALVLLDEQDRSAWDREQIAEGRGLVERATALGGTGPYVLQAAIAELHVTEPRDWRQIELLYRQLGRLTGSPVVEMNRAVAIAELEGPDAALAILDGLELDGYRYLHSTRADMLRRLGRDEEARSAYGRALELTDEGPERRFLLMRRAELPPPANR
ncbi:MAG TPA: sigma-70 family RNA polymerase sigma factor [Solirubrobacterales bacterium]|nr:sigma-70 family RNA polymerase sigma factor [Solirubrobacterales bacterium]